MMAEMVRVNTRVSKHINDWLDKESEDTGVPKSTLIFLALDQYVQQKTVMKDFSQLGVVIQKLEELEKIWKD
mgnify:CR=1 FL=1